mgnify:CR=1 FL=1
MEPHHVLQFSNVNPKVLHIRLAKNDAIRKEFDIVEMLEPDGFKSRCFHDVVVGSLIAITISHLVTTD